MRSMVLLAQLIKVPDRDESFVAVNEKEREELSKVLNTMGTINSLL